MTMIWKRDTWLNPGIPFTFNRNIIEYDMQSAGLSLIQEFQLLPQSRIDALVAIPTKEKRNRAIGMIERKNKDLVEKKKLAFQTAREMFFVKNRLEESDVLSIKKDAIFTTREVTETDFGKYIHFRKKNQYTSYLRVGKQKLELYCNSVQHKIDVKGIGDEMVELHTEGLLKFFSSFVTQMEMEKADDARSIITNRMNYPWRIIGNSIPEVSIGRWMERSTWSFGTIEKNNWIFLTIILSSAIWQRSYEERRTKD